MFESLPQNVVKSISNSPAFIISFAVIASNLISYVMKNFSFCVILSMSCITSATTMNTPDCPECINEFCECKRFLGKTTNYWFCSHSPHISTRYRMKVHREFHPCRRYRKALRTPRSSIDPSAFCTNTIWSSGRTMLDARWSYSCSPAPVVWKKKTKGNSVLIKCATIEKQLDFFLCRYSFGWWKCVNDVANVGFIREIEK